MPYAFLAATLVAGLSLSAPALADTFTLTTNGGNGYWTDLSQGGTLTGATSAVQGGDILTTWTAIASVAQSVSLQWSYITTDPVGPSNDIAGLIVNGSQVPLSTISGGNSQSGFYNANISLGGTYGVYVDANPVNQFSASLTVKVLPLPATLPLLASGLGLIGLMTLKRKRKLA